MDSLILRDLLICFLGNGFLFVDLERFDPDVRVDSCDPEVRVRRSRCSSFPIMLDILEKVVEGVEYVVEGLGRVESESRCAANAIWNNSSSS